MAAPTPAAPRGSPHSLAVALARVAELMDGREDALILYTTSHGAPFGLYYNDADHGYGAISPLRMKTMLDRLGIGNRLLILSACYSGVFVPVLQSPTTAIVAECSRSETSVYTPPSLPSTRWSESSGSIHIAVPVKPP